MSLEQVGLVLFIACLAIVIYFKNKRIAQLEARIGFLNQRLSEYGWEDERLIYLRVNLTHLDKIKAIRALRERYPELTLVEANNLWKMK